MNLETIKRLWLTSNTEGRKTLLEKAQNERFMELGRVIILGTAPLIAAPRIAYDGSYWTALCVFGFGLCAIAVYWPTYRRWTAWMRWAEKEIGG